MTRVYDRIPNTPDPKDWQVRTLLGQIQLPKIAAADPLADVDAALTALIARAYVSKWVKAWAEAVTAYLHGAKPAPAPTPVPTPPPPAPGPSAKAVQWKTRWQLDQGQTGHCVGFGWADRINALEANDPDAATFQGFTNDDAHKIYYEAKVIDGEAGQENGSSTRSGAKAVKARGLIASYAFATTTGEITLWVTSRGPVVVGTDWYEGMENPDARGLVRISGAVLGGHEWLIVGYDPAAVGGPEYICQNSWGDSWGVHGLFRIKVADFAQLLAAAGDACVVVEGA